MSRVIYPATGRAAEYFPLAYNPYDGCTNGCLYCYAPGVLRKQRADFHARVTPRENTLARLRKDAPKFRGDRRRVLMSFICDPYPPVEDNFKITREALKIFAENEIDTAVLTKNPLLARRDFDLMAAQGTRFGVSLSTLDEEQRSHWEPAANTIAERQVVICEAIARHIHTWLSIEPVWDPDQALAVIRWAKVVGVSHIKLGKMNYNAEIEKAIDWRAFLTQARAELEAAGFREIDHYIKRDLLKAGGAL